MNSIVSVIVLHSQIDRKNLQSTFRRITNLNFDSVSGKRFNECPLLFLKKTVENAFTVVSDERRKYEICDIKFRSFNDFELPVVYF
jgi:hypothetical protein